MTASTPDKLKLAVYWASSCGGCEIAILEIGDRILELAEVADIVFWPCIADFKYADVRGYADDYIDLCLFNGAIRSSENVELAELLRAKSKTLVAFGSCAHEGCIPGLANFHTREEMYERIYLDNPSTPNPGQVTPQPRTTVGGHTLELPTMSSTVRTLDAVVDVDYIVPGCPPTAETVWRALEALISGDLPERGGIIGAGDKAVCDECRYVKYEQPITEFVRPHLFRPDPDGNQCLLEQGLVCLGPATRSGCGALCPDAALGCRGCYGPAGAVYDQGAKMTAVIGSLLDASSEQEARRLVDQIVDPAGTFYRFGLAHSHLGRKRPAGDSGSGGDG